MGSWRGLGPTTSQAAWQALTGREALGRANEGALDDAGGCEEVVEGAMDDRKSRKDSLAEGARPNFGRRQLLACPPASWRLLLALAASSTHSRSLHYWNCLAVVESLAGCNGAAAGEQSRQGCGQTTVRILNTHALLVGVGNTGSSREPHHDTSRATLHTLVVDLEKDRVDAGWVEWMFRDHGAKSLVVR